LCPLSEPEAWARSIARDTRLDRTVAIKILPSAIAANEEVRQRFEREARAVSSLNHPHICSLYDIGRQDGVDFLVMEYIEGETLSVRLKKGALPLDQAINFSPFKLPARSIRRTGMASFIAISSPAIL